MAVSTVKLAALPLLTLLAQLQPSSWSIMAGYHPLASEAEAIEQASHLTELDTLTQTIAARQLIIRDDRTPFLWRQFEGKPCWEVNFDGVSLDFARQFPDSATNMPEGSRCCSTALPDSSYASSHHLRARIPIFGS